MSTALQSVKQTTDIEQVLVGGDLGKLSSEQRVRYVQKLCADLGLNILSRPFDFMNLQGRLVLYANKGAAEQLRTVNRISITVTSRERIEDVYVVTARARMADGREDESTGAVNIAGLKGEQLANAFMKAETKAKRRVTLSICGLNMLDETEVESIPGAVRVSDLSDKYKPEVKATEVKAEVKPEPKVVEVEVPAEDPLLNFVIQVGTEFKGLTLGEVEPGILRPWVMKTFSWFTNNKKEIPADWQEFFDKAEQYLARNGR